MHRWLALIIGVQLLLWFASGLIMSVLPIDRVRGEHIVDRASLATLDQGRARAPLDIVLRQVAAPVREVRYRMLAGREVAEVEMADGSVQIHDAETASAIPPVNAAMARTLAVRAYRGKSAPPSVRAVTSASTEYKGVLPAWRIDFPDQDSTRVYITQKSGRIVAVRNGTWRLYDFFWGLHIMDWKNHEDFNTPWLIGFAGGGLALAIAGSALLYFRWPRKRRRKS